MRLCGVPDCGRRHWARGYCSKHYKRLQRGSLLAGRPRAPVRLCGAPECAREARVRGLCVAHSRRREIEGVDPLRPIAETTGIRPCGKAKCEREHYARGMCRAHYERATWHVRKEANRARSTPE